MSNIAAGELVVPGPFHLSIITLSSIVGIQEKLGILNAGEIYSLYSYNAQNPDELSFKINDKIVVLRKCDKEEREWWWARKGDREGYIPRNLLGVSLVYP
jgi:apoptosis-stimulating of p53 protein 1